MKIAISVLGLVVTLATYGCILMIPGNQLLLSALTGFLGSVFNGMLYESFCGENKSFDDFVTRFGGYVILWAFVTIFCLI